jgi:hypothetical protein
MKKIKNIFYFYLYRKEKEVILQRLFEKKLNLFCWLIVGLDSRLRGNDREEVKMIKKGSGNSSTSRKKFHPNVVAVLFVTVLTCCC